MEPADTPNTEPPHTFEEAQSAGATLAPSDPAIASGVSANAANPGPEAASASAPAIARTASEGDGPSGASSPEAHSPPGDSVGPQSPQEGQRTLESRSGASVVPLRPSVQGSVPMPSTGNEPSDDSQADDPEAALILAQARPHLHTAVPSHNSIQMPDLPDQDAPTHPNPISAMRGKNPVAAAIIATETVVQDLVDRIGPTIKKLEKKRNDFAPMAVAPGDEQKPELTFLARLYVAGIWLTWFGFIGAGAFFIEAQILQTHSHLRLTGVGPKELIPALSVAFVSSILASEFKGKQKPALERIKKWFLWVGFVLFMTGLIQLVGNVRTDALWTVGWFGARLFGETFLATCCRLHIDEFFNRYKRRTPNSPYVSLTKQIDVLAKVQESLVKRLIDLAALKNAYEGMFVKYKAAVDANTPCVVSSLKVRHEVRKIR